MTDSLTHGASPYHDPPPRLRDLVPAAVLALAGGLLLTGLTLFLDAVPGHYIVLGAPGSDAARLIYDAGGLVVNATAWPNLVIGAADAAEGFPRDLRARGAWLVLPAPAAGCLTR